MPSAVCDAGSSLPMRGLSHQAERQPDAEVMAWDERLAGWFRERERAIIMATT